VNPPQIDVLAPFRSWYFWGTFALLVITSIYLAYKILRYVFAMPGEVKAKPTPRNNKIGEHLFEIFVFVSVCLMFIAASIGIIVFGTYLSRQQDIERSNRGGGQGTVTAVATPASPLRLTPTGRPETSQSVPAPSFSPDIVRESSFKIFKDDPNSMLVKFAGSEMEGVKTLPLAPAQCIRITYQHGVIYPDLNVGDEQHPIEGVPFSQLNRPPEIASRFRYQPPYNAYAVLAVFGDRVFEFRSGTMHFCNTADQEQTVVLYYNDAQPYYTDNGGNATFLLHRYTPQ